MATIQADAFPECEVCGIPTTTGACHAHPLGAIGDDAFIRTVTIVSPYGNLADEARDQLASLLREARERAG